MERIDLMQKNTCPGRSLYSLKCARCKLYEQSDNYNSKENNDLKLKDNIVNKNTK